MSVYPALSVIVNVNGSARDELVAGVLADLEVPGLGRPDGLVVELDDVRAGADGDLDDTVDRAA